MEKTVSAGLSLSFKINTRLCWLGIPSNYSFEVFSIRDCSRWTMTWPKTEKYRTPNKFLVIQLPNMSAPRLIPSLYYLYYVFVFFPWQKRTHRMNVLGSPSPLHPSSMNTGTPTETTNASQCDPEIKRSSSPPVLMDTLIVQHWHLWIVFYLLVLPSDPQDPGVVPWSYHERGSPQNDYTTRPSRWVSEKTLIGLCCTCKSTRLCEMWL